MSSRYHVRTADVTPYSPTGHTGTTGEACFFPPDLEKNARTLASA